MVVKRATPDGGDVSAPPPSPIPTAKGVRSAANDILSRYLDKSVHVPGLVLPGVGTVKQGGLNIPEEIDLASRDREAVAMRSARQTGAVRVRGHGIGREEMKAVVSDAERIFRVLEERDTGLRQNLGGDREEIILVGSSHQDHHRMAWARQYIGPQLYRSFREKMENLRSKLEATAEEMNRIIFTVHDQKAAASGNYIKQGHGTVSWPGAGAGGSVLSIYRHNNNHHMRMTMHNDGSRADNDHDAHGHVLNLHLPAKSCEFRLHSGHHGHGSSFEAGPETVIVTIGKQLQERSMGEFKSVSGRIFYDEQDHRSRHDQSFSMELKWSSPDPIKLSRRSLMSTKFKGSSSSASANYNTTNCCRNIISLQDQLLFALIILSSYSFLFF